MLYYAFAHAPYITNYHNSCYEYFEISHCKSSSVPALLSCVVLGSSVHSVLKLFHITLKAEKKGRLLGL